MPDQRSGAVNLKTDIPDTSGSEPGINPAAAPYAGVLKRLWAGILDFIACYLLITAGILALIAAGISDTLFDWAASAFVPLMFWLYFAGFESSARRATPGKMASRIVVTDAGGERISFARASLRCLGRLAILVTLGLGLIIAVFDRQRRGLDDFIAGTRVRDMEALVGTGPRPTWRKLIGPMLFLALIAGMAKVASDAQRDFQTRASVATLMREVRGGLQAPYAEFYASNRRAPVIGDLPFKHPAVRLVEIDAGGALLLHLSKPESALLRLTPHVEKDGAVASWACRVETENPQRFPANCRP